MTFIQDIVPPGGKRDRSLRLIGKSAVRVHQATNLPTLAGKSMRRAKAFDVVPPQSQRAPSRPNRQSFGKVVVAPNAAPNVSTPGNAKKRSRLSATGDYVQYPLIAGVAIAAAYSSTVGQGAIGIYCICAVIWRINIRYTFISALILLASIPLFQVINETGVSRNAAVYAYEVLVVGTVQAVIELWLDGQSRKHVANEQLPSKDTVHKQEATT